MTLRSRGELSLGAGFTFEQETDYKNDAMPLSYEFRAFVQKDTQIVRTRFTPDSLFMEARVQGAWSGRDLARPTPTALMDNMLTSQTQMALWGLSLDEPEMIHAVVPQRLLVIPSNVRPKGKFSPPDTLAEDRGQPLPVSIPADLVSMSFGPLEVQLVVSSEERWILQAAVPTQGARFELRELRRGEDIVYEAGGQARPPAVDLQETDISFRSDGLQFVGSLCTPREEGPFPTVLLLQGSGPLDRDETVGPNAPFLDIAHGLARRGIATFRYDKRTYLYPQHLDIETMTLDDEMIRDAETALGVLVERAEVRSGAIFVLGHSLGGTAALLLDSPAPSLKGVVLLATMGRPFAEVLESQIRYLAELGRESGRMTPEEEEKTGRMLDKLDSLAMGTLPKNEILLGMPVSYMEDLDRRDTALGAQRLGAPILILQGGKDYQVTREDVEILERQFREVGLEDVESAVFDDLGHLFMPVEGKPRPEVYLEPGKVDERVLDRIASWIDERMERP
jgi:dienelactone hydrolase